MSEIPIILAWMVIAVAPVHWVTVYLFWRLTHARPDLSVLRAVFYLVLFTGILVTAFGLVFLNNDIIPPPFNLYTTQIVTRTIIFLAIVPVLSLLILYRRRLKK